MSIGQIGNFNPMDEFTKLAAQNGMQLGKFSNTSFGGNNVLEGHISMDVPSISDMTLDADTLKDLAALNVSPTQSSIASSNEIDSADRFHKKFVEALKDGVESVNDLQVTANNAKEYFASGGDIDIHSVLIASQKAKMGLEMATQLRNQMISAYKEITKMSF